MKNRWLICLLVLLMAALPSLAEENQPLTLRVKRKTSYVYINEQETAASIQISGGQAPYSAEITFSVDGVVKDVYHETYEEPGEYVASRMPRKTGGWRIRVDVTDASGTTKSQEVRIAGSARNHKSENEFFRDIERIVFTGDWRVDVVLAAQYQIGYEENRDNYAYDDLGIARGATYYGEWMGNPYSEWCASFIAYSMQKAGVTVADELSYADVSKWVEQTQSMSAYRSRDYQPQSGDLVFFIPKGETEIGHIGLVEFVTENTIATIEGNVSRRVSRCVYHSEDERIAAYASMEALMAYAGIAFEAEAPWVHSVNEIADGPAFINTGKVNLRAAPRKDGTILFKQLKKNTEVLVKAGIELNDDLWYQVEYNGRLCYLRGELLDLPAVTVQPEEECRCPSANRDECFADCACKCHGLTFTVEEDP